MSNQTQEYGIIDRISIGVSNMSEGDAALFVSVRLVHSGFTQTIGWTAAEILITENGIRDINDLKGKPVLVEKRDFEGFKIIKPVLISDEN